MENKDRYSEQSESEKLTQEEINMLRARNAELGDRSRASASPKKPDGKLKAFVKKNPFFSAAILIFALAVLSSLVLLIVNVAITAGSRRDYVFTYGEEEVKVKYEDTVIDDVLYIDMNRLAQYASLSVSGSSDTMKYVASEGQYLKFTNESEYAVINGARVVITAPAIVSSEKCLVPYSFVKEAVASGILLESDAKNNTVKITRLTYTLEDKIHNVDITFTSASFRTVAAIADVFGVQYVYKNDISKYLSSIDPENNEPYLLLVNKNNPLGKDYVPEGLYKIPSYMTAIGEEYYLNETAALALIAMLKDMPNYEMYVTSAYRDYEYQRAIYEQYVKAYTDEGYTREKAEAEVSKTSALPGSSEHQSGLCVDFMTTSMKALDNSFEETLAFGWLSENAYKYGFVLRYPEDKTEVTMYDYESWHYRFVGRKAATEMYFSGLCLEEYLELI